MRQAGQTLRVGGWVKTGREAGGGAWVFLEVNDGSCFQSLQVGNTFRHTRCRLATGSRISTILGVP
jgi:aspartyl/asparaginyl-tRNA synthetase